MNVPCPSNSVIDTMICNGIRDSENKGYHHPYSFYDSNKKIESKIKELKSLEINEDFIHKRVKRLKGEKVDIYTSNKDFIEFLKYAIKVYNKILKFGIYLDKNSNIIPVLEYDLISSIKKELEDKLRKIRYINYVKSTEKKLNAR